MDMTTEPCPCATETPSTPTQPPTWTDAEQVARLVCAVFAGQGEAAELIQQLPGPAINKLGAVGKWLSVNASHEILRRHKENPATIIPEPVGS